MDGATLKPDALLPQAAGGTAPGAALAVLVHAALLAALTLGVNWRTHSPEVVSAELWAAVPQTAALAPPPPTPAPAPAPTPEPPAPAPRAEPPPPAPDIALERERERKRQEAERRRADEQKAAEERQRRDKAEAERVARQKAAEKAEEDRLARQREENLRRIMAQAGTTGSAATGSPTGTAAQNAAPSASYAGRVRAAIKPNLVFTSMAEFNAAAEVEVSTAPGGTINSRRLIKSSGYPDWDEAVLRAIDKTGRLPADTDGRVPPRLIISFRPND